MADQALLCAPSLSSAFKTLAASAPMDLESSDAKSFSENMDTLPVELRLMIWSQAISDTNEGTTPTLIKALRPHPKYYQEALEVWYDTAQMMLSREDLHDPWLNLISSISINMTPGIDHVELRTPATWCMDELSPEVLQLVKVLKVMFIDNAHWLEHPSKNSSPGVDRKIIENLNIRELHLYLHCPCKGLVHADIPDRHNEILSCWLERFKMLKCITIDFRTLDPDHPYTKTRLQQVIDDISANLDIPHDVLPNAKIREYTFSADADSEDSDSEDSDAEDSDEEDSNEEDSNEEESNEEVSDEEVSDEEDSNEEEGDEEYSYVEDPSYNVVRWQAKKGKYLVWEEKQKTPIKDC